MDRKINITIDPLGRPKIEAINFQGGSCSEATKGIEMALSGPGGVDRVLKPEWHENESADQHEQEHQW